MSTTQLALFEAPRGMRAPTGYVYFGTDGVNIKIGYSTSPRRRGGELKITQLLTFLGGVEDERRHHRIWARFRIGGSEWFRSDPELLEWLDRHVPQGTRERMSLRALIFRRQTLATHQ